MPASRQDSTRLSAGAFDVTVAPLVRMWGFGPGERLPAAPDVETLARLRGRPRRRRTPPGPHHAALFFAALVAVFVRRPYCHWVCPVDTVGQALRPLRRRLVGPAAARGRRFLPLPLAADTPSGPRVDALERFRWRLVTAIGLFVVLPTVGHLGERVAAQTARAQENLIGQTFVTLAE